MNNVYNSIMKGLAEAINDAQSSEKKLKRRGVFWGECIRNGQKKFVVYDTKSRRNLPR